MVVDRRREPVSNPGTRQGYRRVLVALRGGPPDRVPRGELKLPPELVRGLTGGADADSPGDLLVAEEEALRKIRADMTSVVLGKVGEDDSGPWAEELAFWAGRDFFVWAVIDGPFQAVLSSTGWQGVFGAIGRRGKCGAAAREMGEALEGETVRIARAIRTAVARGADGIVLGEDIASYAGLLVSPAFVREELQPRWSELVSAAKSLRTVRDETPLIAFHSDGRIHSLFDDLILCGFDAVHSLEPEAGMEVGELLARYRGKIGLMGGLSVDRMVRDVESLCREARRLATLAEDGGLVLGSTAGILPADVPVENVLRVYAAID